MKRRAGKTLAPDQGWNVGPVQLSGGRDQGLGFVAVALSCLDDPMAARLVPEGFAHFCAKADMRLELIFSNALFEIFQYVALLSVFVRPVGPLFERKRIKMRWHIAAGARIAIVAPYAADRIRFFQDDKIVETGRFEFNAEPYAAESRPDNDDPRPCCGA